MKRTHKQWLVESAAAMLAVVLLAGCTMQPGNGPSSSGGPGLPAQTWTPDYQSPELPRVIADPPVMQAIDVPVRPTLGPSWAASGEVPTDYSLITLTTPCGVLISIVQKYGVTGQTSPNASMSGYDVATGQQLWSSPLQQVTGQDWPSMSYVSYTKDCHAVIEFTPVLAEGSTVPQSSVVVALDVKTGAEEHWPLVSTWDGCAATGERWAACWHVEDPSFSSYSISSLDLSKPGHPTAWTTEETQSPFPFMYEYAGYLIDKITVGGHIWTPKGYCDPATGAVVFGADVYMNPHDEGTSVIYQEPHYPGDYPDSYSSGVVVRATGFSSPTRDTWTANNMQLMLWDQIHDKALWPRPAVSKGVVSNTMIVSGQALLVSTPYLGNTGVSFVQAFSLSDGSLLWEKNNVDLGQASPVFVNGGRKAVRISDGTEVDTPDYCRSESDPDSCAPRLLAKTMAYGFQLPGQNERTALVAYGLDPQHPDATPQQAWSIPLPDGMKLLLSATFTTGGVMYLGMTDSTGALYIAPLLTS